MNKVEYTNDIKTIPFSNGQRLEFYFKNSKWELLSYMVLTIVENQYWKTWFINELTTANWYNHLPERLQKIYLEKWYKKGTWIKHFWELALNEILLFSKKNYPDLNIIVVPWLQKNKKHILDLVTRVKSKYSLILETYWETDNSICTIRI